MRRKNSENIGDVISQVLRKNNLDKKLHETRVLKSWGEILGANIEKYTENIYFANSKLYVELTSSVLRQELFLSKEKIIASLNKHVGANVVKEIIFR